MPIPFTCPHCGQLLSVGSRKVGQPVQCVRCRGGVIVPAPPDSGGSSSAEPTATADDAPSANPASHPTRWEGHVEVSRSAVYSIGGLIVAVAIVSFLLGWAMGRDSSVAEAIRQTGGLHRIRGQLTYLTERGRFAIDSEATVVALPVARKPDEKLDVQTLRPEALPPGTQHPTVLAIRSLGGDVTRTGTNGEYELELPESGTYHLLMISNHVQRPADRPPTTTEVVEIGQYFHHATELLGQNDYFWSRQRVRQNKIVDHQFGQR